MSEQVVTREQSGWLRGGVFVVGGSVLLIVLVVWLGNLYLAPIKVAPERAYGGPLPETVRVLNAIQTEHIRIVEFSLQDRGLKIGVAVAPGTKLDTLINDPVEVARAYHVEQKLSPGVPVVLVRYLAAQFDAWRSGEKENRVVNLFGQEVPAIIFRSKAELRHLAAFAQSKEGAVVIVAQRNENAPEPAEISEFMASVPRFR